MSIETMSIVLAIGSAHFIAKYCLRILFLYLSSHHSLSLQLVYLRLGKITIRFWPLRPIIDKGVFKTNKIWDYFDEYYYWFWL